MAKITVPKLERIIFQEKGNKNIIKQLIVPSFDLNLNIIENGNDYIIIEQDNIRYYLTSKLKTFPVENEYVLLTNIKPTIEFLSSGQALIKKWLKHPDLIDSSVDEVIESWKNTFSYKEEDYEMGMKGLRLPQIGALHMMMGHLKIPEDIATVVLPTGTGKTETMLSALIANQCKKLLVTVPTDSLRTQISEKFQTLGLLKEFEVVNSKAKYPIVGTINKRFNSIEEITNFFQECNVIITTMSILTGCSEEEQETIANLCSNIFIDEAHHVKASAWNDLKNKFSANKIIQFTATPFRNDGQRLDGKIIFNFPLRKAQEQGYFKTIDFISIREYDPEKADYKIAKVAIERLREDIKNGYNHILMARCNSKERAKKIYEIYREHTDLNPVLIYSGSSDSKETYNKIISKEAKVIVCVDMLGEGFDLPELKIAAFHDIKKSLPITLQFAGRFTRTKHDQELGNASFIANLADLSVRAEISELYAHDADWNRILSDTSFNRINEEVEYKSLITGFAKLNDAKIPFQNIRPKLSTVVYKNKTTGWFPTNFSKGIGGYDNLEYKFFDINSEEKLLVIITAKREDVDWVNHKEIVEIKWDMIVVFWETRNNLLFINSSDNTSLYTELAQAIIGDNAELIKGINVFKTFYNIKRTKLQNVGLRYFLGRNTRFRMLVGSDVGETMSLLEKQRGEKAFVMGAGYENGEPVNVGASYKGRIWTKLMGDLLTFKNWCTALGNKLANDEIDPNQILKETLIPTLILEIPMVYPVWIDWDIEMYMSSETRFKFIINGSEYNLSNTELCLTNPTIGGPISFSVVTKEIAVEFELELFNNTTQQDHPYLDFRILQKGSNQIEILYGSKRTAAIKFFQEYPPTIWFADGSALTGNEYVELKQSIPLYPRDAIVSWDWTGVDLSKEAQGVPPKIINSIQYKVIEKLKEADFDMIYDDDYAGEVADVIAMKLDSDKIKINIYHLKYAIDGRVSTQIKNLYEVCGQAQKSIHWKHKSGSEFINHLLRREQKSKNGVVCSRLEKGTIADLENLLSIAKKEIPVEFEVYIVQPGFSKASASDGILTLLGVCENYIKEIGGINLKVIASE